MTEIEVKVDPAYKVYIGSGAFDRASELPNVEDGCKILVVTDSNVAKLYLGKVAQSLKGAGAKVSTLSFEAGERSKNYDTYLGIVDALARGGFTRRDMVVALGGGVVGDIAGFAAATYMRGIRVAQLPTTLLAMIDSSIGGKTGIDLPQGKNLLGAFHQPSAVIADLDALVTLPDAEWQCGLGEGIKYACLAGGELALLVRRGIGEELERFISLCADYKARIVAEDEREGGKRKLLNFGHTIGHAIESESGYTLPHGVGVAKGVLLMARAANCSGELCDNELGIIEAMALKCGVSADIDCDPEALLRRVRLDKKANSAGSIDVVKIRGIGNCYVDRVSFEQFDSYVRRAMD